MAKRDGMKKREIEFLPDEERAAQRRYAALKLAVDVLPYLREYDPSGNTGLDDVFDLSDRIFAYIRDGSRQYGAYLINQPTKNQEESSGDSED